MGIVATSLPSTELLSCDQSSDEGQHESPGKHRHWLANVGGLKQNDASKTEDRRLLTTFKEEVIVNENIKLV